MVMNIERKHILAQLKVGYRAVIGYTFPVDGLIVAVNTGGCCGVVGTHARYFATLISPKTSSEQSKIGS